ncbi:MAG TPA: alpha/beta fold hydrolase [Pseudonocardiaceae bacterium]|jgi:alpha-beta hydrolase superfamily lysophospholipase
MRRTLFGLITAVLAATGLATPANAAAAPSCQDVFAPVTLDLLLPAQVYGRLCEPASGPVDRVQLLVHGATYDSRYWDPAYGDGEFSYSPRANADGWATLAIDRVGYGRGTAVPSVTLTAITQALTVHQIIEALRAGTIGGHEFPKVLLNAHSVGAGIALLETATYHDADALALSGIGHDLSPTRLAQIFVDDLRPTLLDPNPAVSLRYDVGYLTTVPGTRASLFYGPNPDPGLVAYDERTKGAISATEAADVIATGFTLPTSLADPLPTYLVDGADDQIWCAGLLSENCASSASLRADEAPFYANAKSFTAVSQPDAGHDLNFAANSADYERALNSWADRTVGS